MIKLKELLLVNYSALGISLTDINDFLQLGILVFSGVISIVASIQKFKNTKKDK